MYAALSAICVYETPDIIKQQQAEIVKLRAINAYAKQRLIEVQSANDKLEATAFRMASRINISAIRQLKVLKINEEDLDEYLRRRYDGLRELNFNVGDTEEIIQAARIGESHELEKAQAAIKAKEKEVNARRPEVALAAIKAKDKEAKRACRR